jgi:hypothetical protein
MTGSVLARGVLEALLVVGIVVSAAASIEHPAALISVAACIASLVGVVLRRPFGGIIAGVLALLGLALTLASVGFDPTGVALNAVLGLLAGKVAFEDWRARAPASTA